jgi:hypothetical protein
MFLRTFWLCGAVASLLAPNGPAHARQTPNNDGFQRRNGQMQVVRNGQSRPMTRDAHLPTGATVTKDGFVVSATGQRTELREGQGCDLRGRPVAVHTAANGTLALGAPSASVSVRSVRTMPAPSLLEQVFGQSDDEGEGKFKFKKHKKHHGKGHGRWKGDD